MTKDFLNDLHNGRVSNEDDYIEKMSISASVGGIKGDFTANNWISDYLSTPIIVWNINSGYKLITFGKELSNNVMHLAFDSKIKHFEPIQKILGLNHKKISIEPENYENIHLHEESILQPNSITSIKGNKELHTLEVMNVKIFESNVINKIEKKKIPIEKSMSNTIQRDFSNSFELKKTLSNLFQLNNDNNHSKIIFRKKRKQITQMNEFFKNAIINPDLDYKAIVVKFISFNEELQVTIPQIIKYIKLLKSKIHYTNKKTKCKENVSIDQHDSNEENKNKKIRNRKRSYIHWKDYDIYINDHIIHNHEYDNIQTKIDVFYELFPDCQLTNE